MNMLFHNQYPHLLYDDPTDPPPPTPPPGDPEKVDWKARAEKAEGLAEQWETRFKGLQPNYQSMKAKADSTLTELEATRAELQTEKGKYQSLAASGDESQKTIAQLQAERDQAVSASTRLTTIAAEFPQLLKFIGVEEDGSPFDLLPNGTGEDLRKNLQRFAARTPAPPPPSDPPGDKPPGQDKLPPAGETPPPPGGDQEPETPEVLFARAKSLFGEGKDREADTVMNAYYTALAARDRA
jgi:hypothetical protein